MRLGRIGVGGLVYLARLDDDGVVTLLQKESSHPAADALREAVAAEVVPAGHPPSAWACSAW